MKNPFYEALSRYYDGLFPVDDKEMSFLAGQLAGARALLDIGCGTGNKTVHFSPVVENIVAFDSDAGMIARARADNARPNIRYEVLDMSAMGAAFADAEFDAVLCLGNTLVHLDGPAQIARLFEDVHALLAPGGLFIVQILNYDRILDHGHFRLPSLESDKATFTRQYTRDGEALRFLTSIIAKDSGQKFDNEVRLYPLRGRELAALLAQAGFSTSSVYGGYAGEPYRPDSFICITVCRKAFARPL